MSEEISILEKLSFSGSDVYLDGEKIMTVPGKNPTRTCINLLGVPSHGDNIFVGTGGCCHGHIVDLDKSSDGLYGIENIVTPNLNVNDMLFALGKHEGSALPSGTGLIVTGQGCAGAGVRLMSTYEPVSLDVVSTQEFYSLFDGRRDGIVVPRLRADTFDGKIYLDLHRGGFRVNPGMRRDPTMPSILVDTSVETFFVSDDLHSILDITDRLERFGVDISKTLEYNKDFHRIRRR
jgi:hypothetical protein